MAAKKDDKQGDGDALPPTLLKNIRAFHIGLKRFRDCNALNDFKILCGDRTFFVNRFVICVQSAYFQKACTTNFMEAHKGFIKLEDEKPEHVEAMLAFFYELDYNFEETKKQNEALDHLAMYNMGEKFQIEALSRTAVTKFRETVGKVPKEDIAIVAREVYENTYAGQRVLHTIVIETLLPIYKDVMDSESFSSIARTVPDLTYELLQAVTKHIEDIEEALAEGKTLASLYHR